MERNIQLLASNSSIEYNVVFQGKLAKKIVRTSCELCGDVCHIKIYWNDDVITEENLEEFHTGCSE